jgi:hypothetical protein
MKFFKLKSIVSKLKKRKGSKTLNKKQLAELARINAASIFEQLERDQKIYLGKKKR